MGALRSALLVFRVPAFGSGPATGSRVLAPRRSVKSSGIPRRMQRRRPVLHRLGTTCGVRPDPGSRRVERPVFEWGAQRWKAPRVRRIAIFFAEDRGRRPLDRWSSCRLRKRVSMLVIGGWPAQAGHSASQAQAGSSGGFVMDTRASLRMCLRRRLLRPASRRARDTRCSSGSGRGEASVASNRGGGRRAGESPLVPGP